MNQTEPHILRQLMKLNAVFPNHILTAQGTEAYVDVLIDLDPLEIEAATNHLLSKVRFYPKPSEIRDAVFDLRSAANGNPTPYEAWEQVEADMWAGIGHPIVGLSKEPAAHPLAQKACRQIGGYEYLCKSDNAVADRARFIDAYRGISGAAEEQVRMLPGVSKHVKRLADKLSRKALPGGDSENKHLQLRGQHVVGEDKEQ